MAFSIPQLPHQHVVRSQKRRFGCIVAPLHPLVSQRVIVPTWRYLDNRHAWFFVGNSPVLASNSLQLLKSVLRKGGWR